MANKTDYRKLSSLFCFWSKMLTSEIFTLKTGVACSGNKNHTSHTNVVPGGLFSPMQIESVTQNICSVRNLSHVNQSLYDL